MNKTIYAFKYLLLVLCCLTPAGCVQTFSLELAGMSGDRPVFKLEEKVLLTSILIESRLPQLEDETGYFIRETAWSANIPGWRDRVALEGRPMGTPIEILTYGQPIKGFTEEVAPKKLIPGKYYQVSARSGNRAYGGVVFKIVKQGNKFKAVEAYGFWSDIFGPSRPGNLIPEDLEKSAQNGDPEAQYQLGLLNYYGDGVWDDFEEAYKWFLESAKQGHAKAQYRVGGLCLYSFTGSNRQESFNWHLKSANQGYHNAQVEIGLAYQLGSQVPQDHKEAVKWFMKAAKQGNARAMKYLARHYREGKGVPRDDNEFGKWFQRAEEILKKAGARPGAYF
jgi:hypothetical protein